MNMGWKLGYITSLNGTRGAVGTTMTASVVEEVGAKYEELAEVTKESEYDGGWALSKGGKRVGGAPDSSSGWYSSMVSGG